MGEYNQVQNGEIHVDMTVIDQLKASLGDDEGFVIELIGQFLENTPKLMHDISSALEKCDLQLLQNAAHSLKSTCATLGATTMSILAANLEISGRNGTMKGVAENNLKLVTAYALAKTIYEDRLRRAA